MNIGQNHDGNQEVAIGHKKPCCGRPLLFPDHVYLLVDGYDIVKCDQRYTWHKYQRSIITPKHVPTSPVTIQSSRRLIGYRVSVAGNVTGAKGLLCLELGDDLWRIHDVCHGGYLPEGKLALGQNGRVYTAFIRQSCKAEFDILQLGLTNLVRRNVIEAALHRTAIDSMGG